MEFKVGHYYKNDSGALMHILCEVTYDDGHGSGILAECLTPNRTKVRRFLDEEEIDQAFGHGINVFNWVEIEREKFEKYQDEI